LYPRVHQYCSASNVVLLSRLSASTPCDVSPTRHLLPPRVPVVPPTGTCRLLRPPRLRDPLKEVPEIPRRGLLYHSRFPLHLSLPASARQPRSSSSLNISGGGVYTFHTPSNNFLRRAVYAKVEDVQRILSGNGSRFTDSKPAIESCVRTTDTSN
jgi:hypothetical protein